jgi:hypothetical protein
VFGNERALVVCSWHEDIHPSVIAHGEEQAMLYTQMPFGMLFKQNYESIQVSRRATERQEEESDGQLTEAIR